MQHLTTFLSAGYPMDAEPRGHHCPPRLRRMEGEVRRQGPALLLAAQRLPADDPRTARRDPPPSHLPRMPKQLPLVARPYRRRI